MSLAVHEIKTIDDLIRPGTSQKQELKELRRMPAYFKKGIPAAFAATLAIYCADYVPKMATYGYSNVPFRDWAEASGLSIIPILIWGFYCVGKAYLLRKALTKND